MKDESKAVGFDKQQEWFVDASNALSRLCSYASASFTERSQRNEFARAALTGLLASKSPAYNIKETVAGERAEWIARTSFDIADEMLAEAKRRDAEPKS